MVFRLYEPLRSHLATLELGSYTLLKYVALKVNNWDDM